MIKNTEKINRNKKEKILNGLLFIDSLNKQNDKPYVEKVILFGSGVTSFCREDSDIDICLVTNFDCSNKSFFEIYGNLPLVMDDLCDIVIYSKLQGKLKEEIDSKGVVIYEY